MADVTLRSVKKSFGKTAVIHGVDLVINQGELVVFVGPSGCGKSTLLRLIAGLEDISGGDILIGGEVVNNRSPKDRQIAMVFQSYALYPHMSVFQNMSFGLQLSRHSKQEIKEKVHEVAKVLELTDLLERKPKQLSGGQRQRVAIGRAIVRNPRVFLFDEPLSNLDAALRVQMRIEIAKLHREMGATMVYVTHDQVEAMTLADRIVVLSAGRIEQVGAPLELYHKPCNKFVAGFIGSPKMNFMRGTLMEAGSQTTTVKLDAGPVITVGVDSSGAAVGSAVTVGIRPEHILVDQNSSLELPLEVIEELGESHFLYAPLSTGEMLTIQGRGDTTLAAGSAIRIQFPEEHCHLFDADGKAFARTASAKAEEQFDFRTLTTQQ
ncbi:sn-glycerol-3-phosphate ABC transporter ATP-binding protein UgpC [Rhodobacteraceae bacterium RKSG542]|uniref:ABC transporter ATP-binding protein n=1 Tax=Pseudovibrio flavus TaxID=2529854 RepID=UPI0012BB9BC5|nr:sn-glycerol-3-phosphate ABC transporter ATP-binding protein UgpC [Pseudovibrio flavus]MTI17091.1 sn-glycerol-3-phosphate ABC transporter ATP-binding protein UgpC [Pseudovibrio flavus]